jgi:hypothetical protein
MTRLTAGLLAHGSSALFRLPAVRAREGANISGFVERGLAAYSCGGSQGIGFANCERLTLFPLASLGRKTSRFGNHRAAAL